MLLNSEKYIGKDPKIVKTPQNNTVIKKPSFVLSSSFFSELKINRQKPIINITNEQYKKTFKISSSE